MVDGFGHEMNVVAIKCRPVIVCNAASLAARRVVGGKLLAQFGIAHRLFEMVEPYFLQTVRQEAIAAERQNTEHIHECEQEPTVKAHEWRESVE